MARSAAVHLVRVRTDDNTFRIWVCATSPEEAVLRVLNSIPEGWTVVLTGARLRKREVEVLAIQAGEVRELFKDGAEAPQRPQPARQAKH